MSRTAIIPNWCRVALLAVALAIVALLLTRCTHGRAEYHRRIAALRAAGEPVTTADCAARYPTLPPERDFRQLLRSVLPASSDPLADPYYEAGPAADRVRAFANREPFDSGLLGQVRLELASNAAPVELLLRTDLAGFGFVHQWTNGLSPTYNFGNNDDDVPQRINLGRVLALQAAYEAELGNGPRAATALVRGFQVAHLPAQVGTLTVVGQLGSEGFVLWAVKRTLNRTLLTDADLRRLGETLLRPCDLLRESLLVEQAKQINWWNESFPLSDLNGPIALSDWGKGMRWGFDGRLRLLDRWAGRLAATRLPMREQLAAIAAIDREILPAMARPTTFGGGLRAFLDRDYVLLLVTEASLARLFNDNALRFAGLANAQAAVAIERWRLAHPGRLPDTLAELVPAYLTGVPQDPYDGQPVRYKKLPVGYVVYSVGTGWTDHGEQSLSAITLTVER